MFGQLTTRESREFLDQHIYGRIGCHAFGKTYVVPISYAYKEDKLYFRTLDGLKVKMMRANPEVCFQVDSFGNASRWRSVIVQGLYKELNGSEKEEAIRVLLSRKADPYVSETVKLTPAWPFTSDEIPDVSGIVFSIEIEEISGRFERAVLQEQ